MWSCLLEAGAGLHKMLHEEHSEDIQNQWSWRWMARHGIAISNWVIIFSLITRWISTGRCRSFRAIRIRASQSPVIHVRFVIQKLCLKYFCSDILRTGGRSGHCCWRCDENVLKSVIFVCWCHCLEGNFFNIIFSNFKEKELDLKF